MNRPLRIFLLIMAALLATAAAYEMSQRPLWSYYSLGLFAAIWLFWRLLRLNNFSKINKSQFLLGVSSLSGLLLSPAFWLPIPFSLLLFIAFIPLFYVENEIKKQRGRAIWQVFKYAFHAFVVWNILTTFWVANSALIPGIIAIFANSFLMTLPFLLFHIVRTAQNKSWFAYFAFITFWLTFEFIHLRWDISWAWLTLGNGLAGCTPFIQWYEYTGALGGSLLILLTNVFLYKAWLDRSKISVTIIVINIIILAAISFFYYQNFDFSTPQKTAEVVIVQPNYEPHFQKFEVSSGTQLNHFLALSDQKVTTQTNYLLFPETSFDRVDVNKIGQSGITLPLQNYVEQYPNLHLITGIDAYKILSPDEPSTPATRTQKSNTSSLRWEAYNAACQLVSDTMQPFSFYKKSKLVPGAELLPFKNLLSFLKPFFYKFGGTVEGCGTQAERGVFWNSTHDAAIAPVICYESIYGEFVTGFIKNGANAIFIMTNDGWWDDTPGYQQHLRFATLRAIETRRDLARSANSGVSCFINARGDVLQATEYGKEEVLKGVISLRTNETFYVRYGDYIGRIAIGISLLCLIYTMGWLVFRK